MGGSEFEQEFIREQIDDLLDKYKFDEIAELPGFEKVDDRKNWMEEKGYYTCTSHVFGKGKYVTWIKKDDDFDHPDGYFEIDSPEKDDIVFYFNDKYPSHVGKFAGEGKVESKFGIGHIYKHPVMSVPTYYGKPRYFRKNIKELK